MSTAREGKSYGAKHGSAHKTLTTSRHAYLAQANSRVAGLSRLVSRVHDEKVEAYVATFSLPLVPTAREGTEEGIRPVLFWQPRLRRSVDFVKEVESIGFDSLLMAIGYHKPDPIPLPGTLSYVTDEIDLILSYLPGLLSPTLFTQVVNTVSWMSGRRLSLNMVAGISPAEQAYYGSLDHDERHEGTKTFLEILQGLWSADEPSAHERKHHRTEGARLEFRFKGGGRPQISLSAGSPAHETAVQYGDCCLRYADTPHKIAQAARPVLAQELRSVPACRCSPERREKQQWNRSPR